MQVLAGTSGYSYKEWKGSFYPEKLANDQMLRFYGGQFQTVEINSTFYRLPSEKVLAGWAEQVPEGFRFVLKASRRITHQHRLKDAGDPLAYLLRNASVLGDKLGPTLFQLPPNLKKDLARLQAFLALLPNRWPAVFESVTPRGSTTRCTRRCASAMWRYAWPTRRTARRRSSRPRRRDTSDCGGRRTMTKS